MALRCAWNPARAVIKLKLSLEKEQLTTGRRRNQECHGRGESGNALDVSPGQ